MKRVYAITVEDGEVTGLVYEVLTCQECRFFRKNFRLHYMSPGDGESPHICVHENGMMYPGEDDWCSRGREKDHE